MVANVCKNTYDEIRAHYICSVYLAVIVFAKFKSDRKNLAIDICTSFIGNNTMVLAIKTRKTERSQGFKWLKSIGHLTFESAVTAANRGNF